MKSKLFKNNIKTIINTRRRFLSILIMAFLGVGFFSGLRATSLDINDSLNNYLKKSKMYDISIVSTTGLDKDDLKEINKINDIKAYGIKSKEAFTLIDDKEEISKVIGINNKINKPYLVYGKMPNNNNECLLDDNYFGKKVSKKHIGEKIKIDNIEYKIVGFVESPLYMSMERGTSSIGNGSVSLFIYVSDKSFNTDYYTEIGVISNKNININTDGYNENINNIIKDIKVIKKKRETIKYNNIIKSMINNQQLNIINDKLNKMEKPKWYILTRKNNTGYSSILDGIETISNVSKLFPLIFYFVAILMSLTSMTRMIEEERVEIGTLKSLGYTNIKIINKYILYSFLASIIGGFIGMTIGFYLLPNIVWYLYSLFFYTMPVFHASYRIISGLIGVLIVFICIGGATLIAAYNEFNETPSQLMRPKAPKEGKKIFIEKIPFIWNRFNFSRKVTARNIFRYKKRALMTIIGIAGCTGLMVAGFGIKDSVEDIPKEQFNNIFKYQESITLQNTTSIKSLEKYLQKNKNINSFVEAYGMTGKIKSKKKDFEINILVFKNNNDLKKEHNLITLKTNKPINLVDNGIIITDKLASSLNLKIGDFLNFNDSDEKKYNFKVSGIAKNYVGHYVFMSKKLYEQKINKYETNMILLNTKNLNNKERNNLSKNILKYNGVTTINSVKKMIKSLNMMFNSMNYVVILLIIASALLDFVVLYNLANVNILERQREIATLKVLGFYDKEVDNYINKENIVFTIFGIILGMIFGILIINGIISSVEIDNIRLIRHIKFKSYAYSGMITIVFSCIVNLIIHHILKKIDMIESLKSVE